VPENWRRRLTRRGDLFGIAAVGVLTVACCGLLPAVVVLVGAVGLAPLLGVASVLIAAAGVAVALLVGRRRARRCCAREDGAARPASRRSS